MEPVVGVCFKCNSTLEPSSNICDKCEQRSSSNIPSKMSSLNQYKESEDGSPSAELDKPTEATTVIIIN